MSTVDNAVPFARFAVAAASLPGARDLAQDAYGYDHGDDGTCIVAAVADGLGWASGSGVIAEAGVSAVTAFGTALDCRDDPAHLIELARITVALHADYATGTQREAFEDFRHPTLDGPRPDTCLVVATIAADGEVHVGWIGDCRPGCICTTAD